MSTCSTEGEGTRTILIPFARRRDDLLALFACVCPHRLTRADHVGVALIEGLLVAGGLGPAMREAEGPRVTLTIQQEGIEVEAVPDNVSSEWMRGVDPGHARIVNSGDIFTRRTERPVETTTQRVRDTGG